MVLYPLPSNTQIQSLRLGREPSTNYQSHRQQTSSQCPSDIAAKDLSGLANEVMLYQTNAPIGDASLHAWADAQALWSGLARFQGSITIYGNASIIPGCIIKLEGLSKHYSGNAFVQSVEHTLQGGEWKTQVYMGFNPVVITEEPDVVAPAASGFLPGIRGLQIGIVKRSEIIKISRILY